MTRVSIAEQEIKHRRPDGTWYALHAVRLANGRFLLLRVTNDYGSVMSYDNATHFSTAMDARIHRGKSGNHDADVVRVWNNNEKTMEVVT